MSDSETRPRWRRGVVAFPLVIAAVLAGVWSASSEVVSDEVAPLRSERGAPLPSEREGWGINADEATEAVVDLVGLAALRDEAGAVATHLTVFAERAALRSRPSSTVVRRPLPADRDFQTIRRRWGLTDSELAALNPEVDLRNAPPGTPLVVWVRDPEVDAVSIGRPNRGRLRDGRVMPPGVGWVVRQPRLAFGAEQTIEGLIDALRVTLAEHPEGQDMLIADISTPRGGRMRPHRSHQSGRDVDATYFRNTLDPPTFRRTPADTLDTGRTWTFVRALLTRHDIEYIFMARPLQEALYAYAEQQGEHPAFLAEIFQYSPHGGRNNRAVIRFARGHGDHMHIRFGCTDDDIRCSRAR